MNKQKNEQLGVITVTGPDAFKLLQGQLSCDLEKLSENGSYGAHCNHKGRIISFFYIQKNEDAYSLIVPTSMLEITKKALEKYAVFYKVELAIQLNGATGSIPDALFDLKKGIPGIYPETSEVFLPHELDLNRLNAVSYDKGCFTGQEIIARMEHRGKIKKKMLLVEIQPDLDIKRGSDLHNDSDKMIGNLVDFNIDNNDNCFALVLFKEAPIEHSIKLQHDIKMTIQEFKQ